MIIKVAGLICMLFPPCGMKNWILKRLSWDVGKGCKIGFSWVSARHIKLADNARIGHGNLIINDAVILADNAYIGHFNRVVGPLWLVLSSNAGVGNSNKVSRAPKGVTWGRSILKLGVWSKITVDHFIDCTRSVRLGDYSTIAGRGSQLWTHGYLHAPQGLGRFRIDGAVIIGNNVYIGSASVINAGVKIADAITVGSASCVSRSLELPGMYVSQSLRYVELDYEEAARRHSIVRVDGLIEQVAHKKLLSVKS